MGRPKASQRILDFAALFTDAVTTKSHRPYDWVARTGKYSIFSLLARLAPKASDLHSNFHIALIHLFSPNVQTVRSAVKQNPNRCVL